MKQYHIHNTSRDPKLRYRRYAAPHHRGLTQRIGLQRVRRGRPVVVSEETLRANLELFKSKEAEGLMEVRTLDGRKVSLDTLTAAPPKPAPPRPVKVEDSVVNDAPSGIKMPIYPDGAVQSTAADKKAEEAAEAALVEESVDVEEDIKVEDEVEIEAREVDSDEDE